MPIKGRKCDAMRGKRDGSGSILRQGRELLEAMYQRGKGTSKHEDKHSGRGYDGKIYSSSTLREYRRKWNYYCRAMRASGYKANGHTPRTLEEAAGYMPQYLRDLQERGLSAWSVRGYFSAPAKVMGMTARDYDLPGRKRQDIKRSRQPAERDRHFSQSRNRDLIEFATCTGLRKEKELKEVRGTDLIRRKDGKYAIAVTGKGGRYRESVIYGTDEEVRHVVERMRRAGSGKVWEHIHSAADIHACRAEYASRMYDAIARDPYDLPRSERYCCRGDMAGQWFDRSALMRVSQELGHSRCNVVVNHYLWRRGVDT